MSTRKIMEEEIRVYLTTEQKNQLRRLADLEQKSLSEYLRDAALSSTPDFAKIENIVDDILYIKKFQYVVTRLMLFVVNEYTKDPQKTMEYFREILADADEKFDEKGE